MKKNSSKQEICEILGIADKTFYNWKQKEKPVILLLEKYFSKDDLRDFLSMGTIKKLEQTYSFSFSEHKLLGIFFYKLDGFISTLQYSRLVSLATLEVYFSCSTADNKFFAFFNNILSKEEAFFAMKNKEYIRQIILSEMENHGDQVR